MDGAQGGGDAATAGRFVGGWAADPGLGERLPIAIGLLPGDVHETPAAVLLVDLERDEVVFVNALAAELAPGMRLPLAVDDWSRAAGLRDAAGDDLAGDPGDPARPGRPRPLSRLARGDHLTGEAVTAARSGRGFVAREPLWVVGLPLAEVPGPLTHQALVVFLPLRHATAVSRAQGAAAAIGRAADSSLLERAALATDLAFTISDPRLPDNPLVWVNPAFLACSGYTCDQVIGRNCRFLQGPGTDPVAVDQIRAAVAAGRPTTATLLNYRADGRPFWNQLSISPIFDDDGVATHFVGVQADVSDRVEAELAREQALRRSAAAEARLGLLAAATNQLAASLDPAETVRLMSQLVVPALGSWALTYLVDARGELTSVYAHHPDADTDPDIRAALDGIMASLTELPPDHPASRILRGDQESVLITDYDPLAQDVTVSEHVKELRDQLGAASWVMVPMTARGATLGVLALIGDATRATYTTDDVSALADLATRAGLALDNARLFAREHQAAETLQRALLPVLPELPGLEISAQYLPATSRNAVGGDWYDVLRLRDGASVGVAIGDVMGHDLAAAASMGQLRSVLRSYAYPGARPAAVLDQLDQLVQSLGMGSLATCVYGRLTRTEGVAGAEFTWANAGHPPPMLVTPGGDVELLTTSASRIVGVPFHDEIERRFLTDTPVVRDEGRVQMPPGSMLLLYTDGLVEDRDTDIDQGIETLRQFVQAQARSLPLAELVSRISATRGVDARADDIAVLAVRIS